MADKEGAQIENSCLVINGSRGDVVQSQDLSIKKELLEVIEQIKFVPDFENVVLHDAANNEEEYYSSACGVHIVVTDENGVQKRLTQERQLELIEVITEKYGGLKINGESIFELEDSAVAGDATVVEDRTLELQTALEQAAKPDIEEKGADQTENCSSGDIPHECPEKATEAIAIQKAEAFQKDESLDATAASDGTEKLESEDGTSEHETYISEEALAIEREEREIRRTEHLEALNKCLEQSQAFLRYLRAKEAQEIPRDVALEKSRRRMEIRRAINSKRRADFLNSLPEPIRLPREMHSPQNMMPRKVAPPKPLRKNHVKQEEMLESEQTSEIQTNSSLDANTDETQIVIPKKVAPSKPPRKNLQKKLAEGHLTEVPASTKQTRFSDILTVTDENGSVRQIRKRSWLGRVFAGMFKGGKKYREEP